MGRILNMTFSSSLTDLCELNSSFDSGVLRICYTGANRNGSFISKEVIEQNIPTIYNCPIVCNYDRETDSIGSHDMSIVSDDDGNMRLVNETQPVGVIPESAQVWFDTHEDENGAVHEYLYADVLLWKRQEAYKKIKEDGVTAHSMEITVNDGTTIDGLYHINNFEFNAFCLLGSAEPCYEDSALQMFSLADVKQQITEMMNEVKETFALVNSSTEDDNILNSTEGGNRALDEKEKLIAEYGIDVSTLDFSINDFTVEELKEKFEAMKAVPDSEEEPADQFALNSNIYEEIERTLTEEKVQTDWGESVRYHMVDYDLEKQEVYCWDSNDWLLYGFSFAPNGDRIEIDFDSKTRMKYVIEEFDDGDQGSPFAATYTAMEQKLHDEAVFETKYAEASKQISSMENELTELRQYKLDVEEGIAQEKRDEIFAKFEDLIGIEAFDNLKENCKDFDLETLEEKCFAIRGRNSSVLKFDLEDKKAPKLKVNKPDTSNEPYGGVFTEYNVGSSKK